MTTTMNAPTTPASITCTRCGRVVRSPLSRLLRVGSHCRGGLTELELIETLRAAA